MFLCSFTKNLSSAKQAQALRKMAVILEHCAVSITPWSYKHFLYGQHHTHATGKDSEVQSTPAACLRQYSWAEAGWHPSPALPYAMAPGL